MLFERVRKGLRGSKAPCRGAARAARRRESHHTSVRWVAANQAAVIRQKKINAAKAVSA
jgi:hypothetical protein